MRNIKLTIEYDGGGFSGWQIQSDLRTVQGVLEEKLNNLFNEKIEVIGSGRTDVGAHAKGQVANFKTSSNLMIKNILNALNSLLPEDVLIKNAEEVALDFNSRFSAKSRVYEYKIHLGKTVLLRKYALEVKYKLDLEKMKKATELLIGEKDFTSFCVAESTKENNICKVISAEWRKEGEVLIFKMEANRFLHNMIRALVGTLVDVGRNYFSIEDFKDILEKKDRREAGKTAPAWGLYLVEVKY
jgi:tRNA pseudouridine38-40 synthase